MCEAVFRKEKQKIFIKNAGIEADEENEEISSVEYTYAGNRRDDCTYDANGNLTASSDGWTVTYNLLNLPASAVKNAGTDDEQTVEWSYLADGTKIAAYVDPSNSSFTAQQRYVITDHLGSTRVVLNNAGSVAERYDYYPYGEKIDVSVASSGNTGKGNLGTQNGYFCPNSAILKHMGQKTTYLVRKRSYDGPVRTNRPVVHRKLSCIRARILKIFCIFRNNCYICL